MSDLYTHKMFARYAGEGYSFQPSEDKIHVRSKDYALNMIVDNCREAVLVVSTYKNVTESGVIIPDADHRKVCDDLIEAKLKLVKVSTDFGNVFEGDACEQYRDLLEAVNNQHRVRAVKALRQLTGCGLKRATEFLKEEFGI